MTDNNTKAVLAEFQASYHEHAGPIYDHERMAAEIVRLRSLVRDAHREGMRAVHDDHLDYDEEKGWQDSTSRKALGAA
ncbi:hypothetical protein [Gemmatimonas sp. UBA7669]|uniref:hypothetical protein n=1 Tax=Gemmatimonas sp. UBA7669 TaxID=1946568 RepID=UPI0025C4F593|nr:hypothetical protein [Gemmatimonas sp. UBA7669]